MLTSPLKRVHVVVDGLDELSPCVQSTIIELFNNLYDMQSVKVMLSSRPHLQKIRSPRTIDIKTPEPDIRAIIKFHMKSDKHLQTVIDGDSCWAGRVAARIHEKCAGQ
jgi:hypothetical protein